MCTVNERLETNVPGIYALGDMNGGPAFTHISYDDFRILRTNLIEGGHATTTNRLVPQTVFIDPQLGRVGMSETDAKQRGQPYKMAKMPMSYVARAVGSGRDARLDEGARRPGNEPDSRLRHSRH